MALAITRKFNFYSGNARRIAINLHQSQRNKSSTPLNLGIMFVPQQVRGNSKEKQISAIKDDILKYFAISFKGSLGGGANGSILTYSKSGTQFSHSGHRSS